jgi:hypothetical protein
MHNGSFKKPIFIIKEYIIPTELNYYVIIAPFNKNVTHYKNKEIICNKPPPYKDKVVTFKTDVTIYVIKYEERRLSMSYYRDLIGKCSRAHQNIYEIINTVTNNFLIPLYEKEEPICIIDKKRKWDEDESPIEILNIWKKNKLIIKDHINFLEKIIKKIHNIKPGKIIMLYLPEIKVNGIFLQAILKIRLSGDTILRIDYDKIDRIVI